ncbi:hypothetical protein [Methanobrevibacter sp.]|uniref:hypothetical protein n=1 Tax=Methanobrevibacter sp. TaxID=66852 RepID=UPI0026DFB017|nr:hypothetical protein [Methanobrevibacter sp.]MDO5859855.1 hypothetical protein [Methanobrevibacter sp.]
MEKRYKIIIAVLVIVIIALVGVALYMLNEQQQQSTQIKVIGNKTIEEDGALNVKLSLLNGTGIKNKKINIIITDKNNKEVLKKTIKTNSKGKAKVNLTNISKGNYVVNITFEGDKNYSANTTSQKIKIIAKKVVEKEPETTSEVTQTTESSQQTDETPDDLGLSQHKASDWEFVSKDGDTEYYTDGRGGELVMHDDDSYEFYDGKGHVVGGINR